MQTEWHNYKSSLSGRVVGSYGYLPGESDENLVHVYEEKGRFAVRYHLKELVTRSGPTDARSLAGAKTIAMRVIIAHLKGQGSLRLIPYI